MTQQMNSVPVSQQVQQLQSQLNQALLEKETLGERAKAVDESVRALRNLLAGVGLGQQLAAEQASAGAVPSPITK